MLAETISATIAYVIYHKTTHPKLGFRKNLSTIKFGRLEVFPCIRVYFAKFVLHFHHWVYLSIILAISIPTHFRFLDSNIVQGFLFGGIVQGFLINKKARRILLPLPLESSDEYR